MPAPAAPEPTPAQPDLAPAFDSLTLLGRGAFACVYRARAGGDAAAAWAAVKVLEPGLVADARARWAFGAEYRLLARLAHPAFPRAGAEGVSAAGVPYFAMALVDGRVLGDVGRLPAPAVRAVLTQAAAALEWLHGQGLVYGDLKAENAILGTDDALSLLDVGLVAPIGQRREAIAGTLEYLAPEAWRQAPYHPAADWYALGVLGYRLWTGELPFGGPPAALARAHLAGRPPALAGRTPDDDPELAAALAGLLAKDPVERLVGAHALLVALGLPEAAAALPPGPQWLYDGGLVGREAQRQGWAAWLDASVPGCQPIALVGGPGMGKTRALEALRADATLAGRVVCAAKCLGAQDPPAASVRALVAQALGAVALAPEPALAAWLNGEMAPSLADLEPAARQLASFAAAARALDAVAARLGPLVLVVDDWHAADAVSRAWLAFARSYAFTAPLYVALSAEDELAGVPTLALTPLDPTEALALVGRRLGGPLPAGLAEALIGAAAGVPALVVGGLDELRMRGMLRHAEGAWQYTPGADHGAAPAAPAAFWAARLARLDPSPYAVGRVLAVASPYGVALPVLADLVGLPIPAFEQACQALGADGLVVAEDDGALRLAIPSLAGPWLAGLTPAEAAAHARALALALLDGVAGPPALLVRATRLLGLDPTDDLAWRVRLAAARGLLAQGAMADALALLAAAPEAAPTFPGGAALQLAFRLARADALRWLDRPAEALADYEAALAASAASAAEAAEAAAEGVGTAGIGAAWVGLAKCRQLAGDYPGALAALDQADAAAARAALPALAIRARLARARICLFTATPADALAVLDAAVALARQDGRAALLAAALNFQAAVQVKCDPGTAGAAIGLLDESQELSQALGDMLAVTHTLDNRGNVELLVGDLPAAGRTFAAQAALCRTLGATTEALGAAVNEAIVAEQLGDARRALTLATAAAASAEAAGRRFPLAASRAIAALAAARLGRHEGLVEALDEALAIAQAIQNRHVEEFVRFTRAEAWLEVDDRARAATELAALADATRGTEGEHRLLLAASLALRHGDRAAARLAAPLETSANRWIQRRASQLAAALALETGDGAAAVAAARAALAIATAWNAPWPIARDHLGLARALRAAGDDHGARVALAQATDMLAAPPLALAPAARRELLAKFTLADFESAAGVATAAEPALVDLVAYADALALATDEGAIGQVVLATLVAAIAADRGFLLLYDEGQLSRVITHGMDYAAELATGVSHTIAEHVLMGMSPLYLVDASADATWQTAASVAALALRTVVALPFSTPAHILGVVYLERRAIDPLIEPGQLASLDLVARLAASAVARERAREAVFGALDRERACALLARRAIGAMAAGPAASAAIVQAVLGEALAAAGADRAFWLEPAGQGPDADWQPVAGRHADGTSPGPDAAISRGVARWVAAHGEPLGLVDVQGSADWKERASIQVLGLQTIYCVPCGRAPDGALPAALLYVDGGTSGHEADHPRVRETLVALAAYGLALLAAGAPPTAAAT